MISLARFASSSDISFLKNGPSTRKAFGLAALVACTCGNWQSAAAQTRTPTTTTLAVTSGTSSSPVSSVTSGSVITLTATVTAGSTPLTVGQVNFCVATAKSCADIQRVGTAQLTKAGTAVVKFRPGPGSHQYNAVFVGTKGYASSVSTANNLAVTGHAPSTTTVAVSGSAGDYDLNATVYGTGGASPGGYVSFLDTSKGNAVLATAGLTANPGALNLVSQPNSSGTDNSPFGLAIADFNGDGIEDFAVISGGLFRNQPSLWILLGKGDGTYTKAYTEATSTVLQFVGMGDFNGDGTVDIAVADSANNLSVLLGKGDGTFTASKPGPVLGSSPISSVVADFNSDGILDLAVVNAASNEITLLLGNGDGTFTPAPKSLQTSSGPYSIATADFNHDGIPDLAVLNYTNGQNTLTIYLGNGAGGFTPVTASPGTGTTASLLSVCDVDGDGVPDLVVLNWAIANPGISQQTTITASVLIGKGDGTFNAGSQVSLSPVNGVPDGVTAADFNGDGKPDLVITIHSAPGYIHQSETAAILLGDGSGGFTDPGVNVGVGDSPTGSIPVPVADLNGDDISDLASFSEPCIDSCQGSINILVASSQSAAATATGVALPIGTDIGQVIASYEGDSNNQPSVSPAVQLTSGTGTPTVTITASANPVPYGTVETLTFQVSGPGVTPTGRVTFYDGSGQLGIGFLNASGVAMYLWSTATLGSHSITATYSGDANYMAGASAVLKLVVQGGTPGMTVTPAATRLPAAFQSLSVVVSLTGIAGSPAPSGTVTLLAGASNLISGGQMFGPMTLVNQSATFTVPGTAFSPGQNTIKATYSPDTASSGFYPSISQSVGVFVLGAVVPVVTLTPSPAVITDQQVVNVAVAIASSPSAGIPTGTVTLTSGSYTAVNSVPGPPFTIPAGTLPDGTDTLTATYSGDQIYAPASGTATVTVSPVVIGATAPSPIAPGANATAKVTLTAGSSYSGTLNLTCALTKSPANAQSPPTCALNPGTDTLASGGNATTIMTVNTTAGASAMVRSKDGFWRSGGGAVTFAALFLIGLGVRRRRWLSLLALLVTAICVVSGGCGGGSSHPTPPPTPATTAGTYVFTVKAADSKNTAITTSADVSVTVQ